VPSRKPELISTPTTLRESLYALVHRSEMPAKEQADFLGVSYSYLCNAANPNLDVCEYQLRLLPQHSLRTKNPVVLDFLEWSAGRVVVDLPAVTGLVRPATAETLPGFVCRLMKEIGDVVKESGERCADADLNQEDKRQIRKEVEDVIQKATQIRAALGAA
jgi:hypothetical protein